MLPFKMIPANFTFDQNQRGNKKGGDIQFGTVGMYKGLLRTPFKMLIRDRLCCFGLVCHYITYPVH